MAAFSQSPPIKWSIWTWLLLLGLLIAASLVSFYLRNFTNSLLLYLPTSFVIVLVHWFGLRILPIALLNSLFTLWLWDAPGSTGWVILLATREPLVAFASWLFCKNLVSASDGLSSTYSFIRFTILGIIAPDFINSLYTYHYTFINEDLELVALLWLSDFITIFTTAILVLHFLRPLPYRNFFKLSIYRNRDLKPISIGVRELIILTLLFIALNFLVDFNKYWFIYGIGAALVAVRNGFDTVILANGIIFILNYIIPLINFGYFIPASKGSTQEINVHLGMGTMFFTTVLIGRAISDLLKTEAALTKQKEQIEEANDKLITTNREMDRFVYSVSHDISAPLKSIKGLINLSKTETSPVESALYLTKMEKSILRLEDFVTEVLDHSRTNRKEIQMESVNLSKLVNEITDNLVYLENFGKIEFKIEWNGQPDIFTDKFLIRVALNNLISNAIKYQKQMGDHTPEIRVQGRMEGTNFKIVISDNGEGIEDTYIARIFEMFYRGTSRSTGSGLGLYIAKEAVEKLGGKISVESTYGQGSAFTISLPFHQKN